MPVSEVKSLTSIMLDIICVIALIGALTAVVVLNQDLWRQQERQDMANTTMAEYAEYAAYNDCEIRGQELVNLIKSTEGAPFVIIYDNTAVPIMITCKGSYLNSYNVQDFTASTSDANLAAVFALFKTNYAATSSWASIGANNYLDFESNVPTSTELQERYIRRGADGASYRSYKVTLIYESNTDNTVVGVIALEV